MKHLIKKEKNILHGTIGWSHNGNDGQYCEAGETVKIKWQPTAGWGLQEVHYTDGGGNVVAIDGGEFVMPDSEVVIGATFKRFVVGDWTEGKVANVGKTFVSGQYGQPITNGVSIPNLGRLDYLPILDEVGEGTLAYYTRIDEYVYWTGESWVSMVNGNDVTPHYLTFTAKQGQAKIALNVVGLPSPVLLYFSLDKGLTWSPYVVGTELTIEDESNVMMRGNNATFSTSENDYYQFVITGYVAANGDVTSLQNEIGGKIELTPNCYNYMFRGCTGLTQAPALPATTLANYCYRDMFSGCTGLTIAPSLPATTLANYCYSYMFRGCTGLTTAPSLPATTLANYCYSDMFRGCTGITSHDVATLDNSQNTFQSNTSCASLTIHAETPPTIGDSTITGLKADCIIYVPAASVDAYKAAQYWSDRSAYIQAMP